MAPTIIIFIASYQHGTRPLLRFLVQSFVVLWYSIGIGGTMISEKVAGRIIIGGLICGFLWLGSCMANAFVEGNARTMSKNDK